MLTAFEDKYATAIMGADALYGGDVKEGTGAQHFVAHLWTSGEPLPPVYDDPVAQELRAKDGFEGVTDPNTVKEFVQRHRLLELTTAVSEDAPGAVGEQRAKVIARTMKSVGLMIRSAFARVTGGTPPTFEEMYTAATGIAPAIHDPTEARERLRAALAMNGVSTTNPKQKLIDQLIAYNAEHQIPTNKLPEVMGRINMELRELATNNVLVPLGKEPFPLDEPRCEALRGVFFTGVSLFTGGEDGKGQPLYNGSVGFNADQEWTEPALRSFLAHEGWPGHYMAFAETDRARRAGRLGFEASTLVIGAPESTLAEGWGQCALQIAFGGTRKAVIDALGPEYDVIFAVEDMDELARNNAAVMHNMHNIDLDTVKARLTTDYVQPPRMVNKLSGAWTTHGVIAPTWSPLYLIGGNTVRESLEKRGLVPTANSILNTGGYVDHVSFRENIGL